jgi:hypothetical protein
LALDALELIGCDGRVGHRGIFGYGSERLPTEQHSLHPAKPIANRPQVNNLPYKGIL